MDLGLRGRLALVCGSSRGLGRACAEALAREGVDVVITGRTPEDVESAVAAISALGGGRVSGLCCDVTTEAGHDTMLAAAGNPDILINNSAGPPPKPFLDVDAPEWLPTVQRYMIAPLLLTQALLPGMIARRFGRIVNIT